MRKPLLLVALVNLIWLTGCGKKAEERPKHMPQEVAFIRECLVVGLRPTILLGFETKAIARAQGQTKSEGPSKAQLADMRKSFEAAASKLQQLANSPQAGKLAEVPRLLGEARAKQATHCSRLDEDWLHGEGVARMMIEFMKIKFNSHSDKEADQQSEAHFKQNWPELINLPFQQREALLGILTTEQAIHEIIDGVAKDTELKPVQLEVITGITQELESRAQKAAAALTPERFYATLIGHQFRPNAGRLEAGEMVKLVITEQKIIGHCIVSTIRLDLRGNRSGQTASLNLSVVHKTYADGRPVRILVVLK
jgi:hypothetical protein